MGSKGYLDSLKTYRRGCSKLLDDCSCTFSGDEVVKDDCHRFGVLQQSCFETDSLVTGSVWSGVYRHPLEQAEGAVVAVYDILVQERCADCVEISTNSKTSC